MSDLPPGWGDRCNQNLNNEKDTSKSKDDVTTKTSTLPSGWGNRNNQMSENDIKLGGVAATKFGGTPKNAYENSTEGGGDIAYKTSDEVRDYYLSEIQRTGGGDNPQEKSKSNVPSFWEDRQKEKMIQAKQMGVFSKNTTSNDTVKVDNDKMDTTIQKKKSMESDGANNTTSIQSAEVALIQIATHTLEKVAQSLDGKDNIKIPVEERAAFAQAMQKAMNALAKQV